MERQRIYTLKGNKLNETERLEICRLLIKAGYTAKIGKEKRPNSNTNDIFVEYWEDKNG